MSRLALLAGAFLAMATPGVTARAQNPNVLLVGPAGTPGAQYQSIQAAVNAAAPGDWVLVWPGVYHEKGFTPGTDPAQFATGKPRPSAVYITTGGLHLRGMNRGGVIVDGTNFSAGQAAGTAPSGTPACSSAPAAQDPGVTDTGNGVHQREGIMVWKAGGVSIENLSVCNSLENEIWWNGGDGTGNQVPMAFHGDYLTTTSTFFQPGSPSGQYGIFTSDVLGPGVIDHSYANNMTDSSYYIGACRDCNTVLEHPHAENSALGLSSTNAGGNLIVENGEWNNNRTGLVSNAQNNDDWPSPQLGQCVNTAPPPGAGPNSCYVIRGNHIHHNNNPNTPGSGLTSVSAIGTGIELVATQHISVVNNIIDNQGAWGVVAHDFPDPETGTGTSECQGGVYNSIAGICAWFARGNFVANNQFMGNGKFPGAASSNPTNGDIANQAVGNLDASACPRGNDTADVTKICLPGPTADQNCFKSNTNAGGLSEWPALLQETPCPPSTSETPVLTAQLVCATGAASLFTNGQVNQACPNPAGYPQHDGVCGPNEVATPPNLDNPREAVCFRPLSFTLSAALSPTMPDPCLGVPVNPWCPAPAAAQAPALPSAALPNTATVGAFTVVAMLGGGGAALMVAALTAWRRRGTRRA